MNRALDVRFWMKVPDRPDGQCWHWAGALAGTGYGILRGIPGRPRTVILAHRLSWELNRGPIADDLTIDHLCLNKRCVNPAHLEPVPRGENSRRFMLARTHCKNGHEFSNENTHVGRNGRRVCKACRLNNRRRCDARRKAGQ